MGSDDVRLSMSTNPFNMYPREYGGEPAHAVTGISRVFVNPANVDKYEFYEVVFSRTIPLNWQHPHNPGQSIWEVTEVNYPKLFGSPVQNPLQVWVGGYLGQLYNVQEDYASTRCRPYIEVTGEHNIIILGGNMAKFTNSGVYVLDVMTVWGIPKEEPLELSDKLRIVLGNSAKRAASFAAGNIPEMPDTVEIPCVRDSAAECAADFFKPMEYVSIPYTTGKAIYDVEMHNSLARDDFKCVNITNREYDDELVSRSKVLAPYQKDGGNLRMIFMPGQEYACGLLVDAPDADSGFRFDMDFLHCDSRCASMKLAVE